MAGINSASLRDEFDGDKADIDALRKEGQISKEADVVISGLRRLLGIVITIFLETPTKKTSKNSSIPPSQSDKDETRKSPDQNRDTSAAQNSMTGENFQTTTIEEVSTVEVCDSCGTDLSDIEPSAREQRVLRDNKFTVEEVKVDAENKDSPTCGARTKGRFPENMPGPLQYGNGIKAFVINLPVTQMVSLNRAVGLVQAMSGIKLSEATCPGYIQRLHDALSWESDTREYLLTRLSVHVDETSLKVDKKTQWMHVAANGFVTLKFLHRKRGKEAIASFGILPVYTGTLTHDCRAAYFLHFQCKHQVCGSHLLRDLAFVIESNGYRWARLMHKLLREICHAVNESETGVLSEAEYRRYRERYRTILTQGGKELPEIFRRRKGMRGRIAGSFGHNLHDRLLKYEGSILCFMSDPDVSFTNNTGEQKIRMSKVEIKVSGCFRTERYAHARCRISSYLDTMAELEAILIALDGNAADMTSNMIGPRNGVSSYPNCFTSEPLATFI